MGNVATKDFRVMEAAVSGDAVPEGKDVGAQQFGSEHGESFNESSPVKPKVVIVTGPSLKNSLASLSEATEAETVSLVSSVSDYGDFAPSFRIKQWDRKTLYSDFIQEGLRYLKKQDSNVVMLFESPSTAATDSTFHNGGAYKMHDYPPSSSASKGVLGPCRYSVMNGNTFASFLKDGTPPAGLLEHWRKYIPGFVEPKFCPEIDDNTLVYAYLPCESIKNHINDPHIHYHLVGKDAIHLMTEKTTKLLTNTKNHRPCVGTL